MTPRATYTHTVLTYGRVRLCVFFCWGQQEGIGGAGVGEGCRCEEGEGLRREGMDPLSGRWRQNACDPPTCTDIINQ